MPVQTVNTFTTPPDWQAEQADIERRRQLAQLLQQQSMQPLESPPTAGGYTIPISPFAGLAKMLQGYAGGKGQEKATQDTRDLYQKQRTMNAAEAQDFMKALSGTPAMPAQAPATPNDDQGNPMPGVAATPAVAPDMNRAMSLAMSSQNPMVMGAGGQLLTQELQKRRMADALSQAGLMPGAQTTPSQALGQQGQGPTPQAAAQIGQPTGQVPPGVSPQAWNLAIAQGDLPAISKMVQEGYTEANKPQNVRPGGTIAQRNPATGQWEQGYYSGQVGLGQTRGPNGNASIIPGFLEGQAALGNTPLEKVVNSDQTISYIPRAGLAADSMAHPTPPQGPPPNGMVQSPQMQPGSISPNQLPPNERPLAAAVQSAADQGQGLTLRGPMPAPVAPTPLGTPRKFGQTQEEQITQARQTAGGKAVDEAFGKDVGAFFTGQAQDATKQLAQLSDTIKALNTPGTDLTGPIRGLLPNAVRNITNPPAVAMKERVEEVVQRSLRAILGAQFTENEGERLIARAYNPQQPPAENAIRVARLQTQLQQALAAKTDAANYFQKNGTLQGWQGKLPTIADFDVGGDASGSFDAPKRRADDSRRVVKFGDLP